MGNGAGKGKALQTQKVYVASPSSSVEDQHEDVNPLAGAVPDPAPRRLPQPRVTAASKADDFGPSASTASILAAEATLTGSSPSAPSSASPIGANSGPDDTLRAELQQMTLSRLKRKARDIGVDAKDVDDFDDMLDPKQAAIECIVKTMRVKSIADNSASVQVAKTKSVSLKTVSKTIALLSQGSALASGKNLANSVALEGLHQPVAAAEANANAGKGASTVGNVTSTTAVSTTLKTAEEFSDTDSNSSDLPAPRPGAKRAPPSLVTATTRANLRDSEDYLGRAAQRDQWLASLGVTLDAPAMASDRNAPTSGGKGKTDPWNAPVTLHVPLRESADSFSDETRRVILRMRQKEKPIEDMSAVPTWT